MTPPCLSYYNNDNSSAERGCANTRSIQMNDINQNDNLTPDINFDNPLGRDERGILMAMYGPQPRLGYPTRPLRMSNGCVVEEYVIPDNEREGVLEKLYPFVGRPSLDDEMLDLHSDSVFTVRDFLVIREGTLNFIAAPKYAEAGGTVLDWFPVKADDEEDGEHDDDLEDRGILVADYKLFRSTSSASIAEDGERE